MERLGEAADDDRITLPPAVTQGEKRIAVLHEQLSASLKGSPLKMQVGGRRTNILECLHDVLQPSLQSLMRLGHVTEP